MELQIIQSKIYEIRGRGVMLDFDLAEIYGVETRTLKQAVRRNLERFPADFMFELSKSEWSELITICDKLPDNIKHNPTTPFAFAEQGVAMLASILRSPIAIRANINIMRAFVKLRELAIHTLEVKQLAQENAEIHKLLEAFINETESKFDDVYVALAQLSLQRQLLNMPRPRMGFKRSDET